MHQRILILDYGSQVTQLIARRVREAGVYCELHPGDVSAEFLQNQLSQGLKGIILSGSHASAYDESSLKVPAEVFSAGVPVLGICYGMQAMAQQLGGEVSYADHREFGYAEVRARGHTRLLKDIDDFTTPEGHGMLKVWMSHGDQVTRLPEGFKVMASTASCPIAGMADEARRFYAVQFHPEVTHTVKGQALLERFVHEICECQGDWTMPNYVDEAIARIREQVGTDEVILGLSGGVDSSVAAALIHKAIGDRLTCVFVDHGLLRLDEGKQVMETFAQNMGVRIIHVDATEQFMGKLAGVSDPEAKRKIIGREFVEVFQVEAGKLKQAKKAAKEAKKTAKKADKATSQAKKALRNAQRRQKAAALAKKRTTKIASPAKKVYVRRKAIVQKEPPNVPETERPRADATLALALVPAVQMPPQENGSAGMQP